MREAVDPIRCALARADGLDLRLELIAALCDLGEGNFAMRTLRSMLLHGQPDIGPKVVATLDVIARPEDARAVARLIRIADPGLHIRLATIAYRLGDKSTYALIDEQLAALGTDTPADIVEGALRSVARIASQRFASQILDYSAREERPWFVARSRAIASGLSTHGLDEKGPEDLFSEAKEAYFRGEHEGCLTLLAELFGLGIVQAPWKHLEASALRESGRIEDAQRACEDGLGTDNKHWETHRLNGSLLWDLKEYERALAAYDRALAIKPTDPFAWYYKGYALYCLEDDLAALPCLDRAISLRKDSPYLYNQKAFCLERLGRMEEAAAAYRKSVALRPTDPGVRDYLGQALQALERYEEALTAFDTILEQDPQRIDTLYRRADVLYDMERWEESQQAYAAFLELRSPSYHGWFNRGLCLRFLERFEEAADCFERALEIRPESENAQKHLSYCLNHDSWLQDT
jgi:tetratricopeptide (TPR) repeat protein